MTETEFAIAVVGQDRSGVIADVTRVLDELGLRLSDSTMTLVRGHFAMTLICDWPAPHPGAGLATVQAALAALATDGTMATTVREVVPEPAVAGATVPYTLTVYGTYRPGTVAQVTATLAGLGANITDLVTRLSGTFYLVTAEVELPPEVELEDVLEPLDQVGARLRVEVNLRPSEADVL